MAAFAYQHMRRPNYTVAPWQDQDDRPALHWAAVGE